MHEDIDARSLALHQLIADKIRRDPSLFLVSSAVIQRWRALVCPATHPYLDQWQQLIDSGMEACLDFATQNSEHARAMRQSSPFVGILSNKERFEFLKNWSQRRATAAT